MILDMNSIQYMLWLKILSVSSNQGYVLKRAKLSRNLSTWWQREIHCQNNVFEGTQDDGQCPKEAILWMKLSAQLKIDF